MFIVDPNFFNTYFEQNASNQEVIGVLQELEGMYINL